MENQKEIWKDVPGYEGIYQGNNFGSVKSLDHFVLHSNGRNRIQKGRVLKTSISKKGYLEVSLSKNKKRFHTGVHRIVALCFLDNPLNLPQVNHKDTNKLNNNLENLEWCTNSENQIHAIENGLCNPNTCEKHHMAKLTNKQVCLARMSFEKGMFTNKELAEEYGVSQSSMSSILRKKTYINI